MKTQIIAQLEPSDRNIYLTINDGELISINYSQGCGDIDYHYLNIHDEKVTARVLKEMREKDDNMYAVEWFFPSPYWEEQIEFIDNAIWKLVKEENDREDLIELINKLEKQLSELKSKL